MNTSHGSDSLEDVMEAEEQQEGAETTVEEGGNEGAECPPSSPVQTRALDMPTFCLMYSTTKTNFWICILKYQKISKYACIQSSRLVVHHTRLEQVHTILSH